MIIKAILVAFFSFFIFLSHILWMHFFSPRRKFFFMLQYFCVVLVIYSGLFLFQFKSIKEEVDNAPSIFWFFLFLSSGFLVILFFYHCYLYLEQIIDRSPATRIMIELEKSPSKRLTLEELITRYSIERKIELELMDLVSLGFLRKDKDKFFITRRGLGYMRITRAFRDFFHLERN